MWTYPSQMITRIRMKENKYGTGSHAVTLAEDEVKEADARSRLATEKQSSRNSSDKESKYVTVQT